MSQQKYQPRYELINLTWNARELDKFLRQEYGYGIFCFAHSLATIVYKTPSWGTWDLWFLKNQGIPYYEICEQESQILKQIKNEFLWKLDEHLNILKLWDALRGRIKHDFPDFFLTREDSEEPLDRESLTKSIYKLGETFKNIDDEINYYQNRIQLFKRKRGRPAKTIFIISAFWSLVIMGQRRIHWKNIEHLIKWFCKKRKVKLDDDINIRFITDSVRRYRTEHYAILKGEKNHFFKEYENPNNPINLQIIFREDEIEFFGLSGSRCNEPKCIKFPDGSSFP